MFETILDDLLVQKDATIFYKSRRSTEDVLIIRIEKPPEPKQLRVLC
jgi:hypothetical protein